MVTKICLNLIEVHELLWPVFQISASSGERRPSVWLDAGIHSNEWVGPATMLYFINQVLVFDVLKPLSINVTISIQIDSDIDVTYLQFWFVDFRTKSYNSIC